MKAIMFGSIGTLVETSEIQRQSFNMAFKEFGLDWYWNTATYCRMLTEPGGKKRILKYSSNDLEKEAVDKIHQLKEKFFLELVPEKLNLRPTVMQVLRFSEANKIRLGFITTTSQSNLDVISSAIKTELDFERFEVVTSNKDIVSPKPDPEVYAYALTKFGLKNSEVLAIEDTPVNRDCAIEAKIKCILFPGEYSEIPPENKYQTLTYNLMTKISEVYS